MAEYKIGVIGLPGKWSTETLADAVAEHTGYRMIIDMSNVSLQLDAGKLVHKDMDLTEFDALIVKKITGKYSPNTIDRLDLLKVAESKGVKVFSRPGSIQQLINRLSCTVTMSNAGIPMPATLITENVEQAIKTVQQYGSAVLKPLFSTKAQGMQLIHADMDEKTLRRILIDFQSQNPTLYIQQKIEFGGSDLGLMFLDNQYLGAYARVGQQDAWNTTIHSGGHYAPAQPSDDVIDIAYRAQKLFNMDYTTVDIAITEHGAMVFEVSAFGGFKGAHEAMNMNIAELYVQHVVKRLAANPHEASSSLDFASS